MILDPAEAKQAEEQRQVVAKMERLLVYAKGFGLASLALLLVIGGIWVYRAFNVFTGAQAP